MYTDPIADMLTRIRNAAMAKKKVVTFPSSKIKFAIAKILEEEEYIESAEKIDANHGEIVIHLKYNNGEPAIKSIKRSSTPGRRVYVGSDSLPKVLNDLGIAIISTSRGLMTNKNARKENLGGEVICELY